MGGVQMGPDSTALYAEVKLFALDINPRMSELEEYVEFHR